MSDEFGNLTDNYTYNAFGELIASTGSTHNRYLYTGQQFGAATGLYSLRARNDAPGAGRFTNRDVYPYGYRNPIELNRYGYGANSPINYIDSTGFSLFESIINYVQQAIRTNGITHYAGRAAIKGAISGLAGFGLGILAYSVVEAIRNDSSVFTEFTSYFDRSGWPELALNTILGAGIGVINELTYSHVRIAFKGLRNSPWMLVRARSSVAVYAMEVRAIARVSYLAGRLTFLGGELMLLIDSDERESLEQFLISSMKNLITAIGAAIINGMLVALVESDAFANFPTIGIIDGEVLVTTFANAFLTAVSKSV